MVPTPTAILLRLEPLGVFLLVLRPGIVTFFALGALQGHNISHRRGSRVLLFDDFGNGAGTDGTATFTDGEPQPLLQGYRRDQVDR